MDMTWTIAFLCLLGSVHGLIGYDCGSRHLNITTVSLLEVGECELPMNPVNVTRRYIQLLQIVNYRQTHVIQCKVEIQRIVYYCGMSSHNSIVNHGQAEYIHEISRRACKQMYETGIFKFGDSTIISEIKINNTITHPMVYAGTLTESGRCSGSVYRDPYGAWENVVVQGLLKITLKEQFAQIDLDNNKIHLNSGTSCTLSETSCIDLESGYTFWEALPLDQCKFDHYGLLYEGLANKIMDNSFNHERTIYTLTTDDVTFALSGKGSENLCGYTVVKTEHPKLFILETTKGYSFAKPGKMAIENLDIFAYVNSKFVYVEKHIKSQIQSLYYNIVQQQCKIERQTLLNALAIANQSPDEFAYNLMNGPGYMATVGGEVVHIIKCVPVEVKLRHGEYCYAELEVTWNNQTQYLTPKTHVLKDHGTRVSCNAILPSYYRVNEEWLKIMPRPVEGKAPLTLKPFTQMTWKYVDPASLATSGIYTEKDLEQLQERIMFPIEKPSLLNEFAKEMHGQSIIDNEGTISKLLNEDAVGKILDSVWTTAWNRLLTFGTISSAVIAIFLIIFAIKTIVNGLVNGFLLHRMYGCSMHILAALCGSVTRLFMTLDTTGSPVNKPDHQQDVEMGLLETPPSAPEQFVTIKLPAPSAPPITRAPTPAGPIPTTSQVLSSRSFFNYSH